MGYESLHCQCSGPGSRIIALNGIHILIMYLTATTLMPLRLAGNKLARNIVTGLMHWLAETTAIAVMPVMLKFQEFRAS